MISFRQYLEESEVVATKRQGLVHFDQMKPVEFVNLIRQLKTKSKGILKDIKVTGKFDGLGARIGKDSSGKIFFEGSRTGPQFEPKAFSTYAKAKGSVAEIVARSEHYDDMLEWVQKASFTKAIPNDVKIVCEVFYNAMAEITDSGLKFVTVRYDASKLGKVMTIVPYQALVTSSGETHPDESKIISDLIKESNDQIKIMSAKLRLSEIDINGQIAPLDAFNDRSIEILQSRKATDKEAKQSLLNVVNAVKENLSDYILNHPAIEGKYDLGSEIEGIVLHLDTSKGTTPFKITTPAFRAAHAKG